MGAANVSSGLFQGITIDMSLSSTASGEAAGERTQLSSLVSAGVILAVVVFLAPLLRNLPSAVLGAIVLSSILGLFNFAEFRRYYRQRKTDFVLALTALVGVLSTSVMVGLAIAVLLSVVMLLYRASRPYIAILGKRASGEYGDMGRHADAQPVPGLVILRLDAPLYFFNANVARTQILRADRRHAAAGHPAGSRGERRPRHRHVRYAARSDQRSAPGQHRSALCPGARLGAAADAHDRVVRPYRRRPHLSEASTQP